jgi:hypothetical protein
VQKRCRLRNLTPSAQRSSRRVELLRGDNADGSIPQPVAGDERIPQWARKKEAFIKRRRAELEAREPGAQP